MATTTRFLTHFSRAVFQRWTQETPADEPFWTDTTRVHALLQDAVANLPPGPLQTELLGQIAPLGTKLRALLRALHADHVRTKQQEADKRRRDLGMQGLGVRALDDVGMMDLVQHLETEQADELVHLFGLIGARNYETLEEQEHKRGLVLNRLAVSAQQSMEKIGTGSGKWSWGKDETLKQVQTLRVLLERVVVQDAVALARVSSGWDGSLEAPWTRFSRLEDRSEVKHVSYEREMAKIYGLLLTLAVYFPIERSNEDEETSDGSSLSGNEEDEVRQEQNKPKQISALAQAQLTTRHVLLAAQMRQRGLDQNNQWLVLVLSFMQSLPKPTTYLDEDGNEALDYQGRCDLLDCVGCLYTRAFASAALFDQAKENATEEETAVQDRGLFEAIVCLRHAAHFMRVERKSNLPTITTAMAQLAGVPLPASFVSWLDHESTADPKSVLGKTTQRLRKKCIGQNRMANLLLSSTNVSDKEMPLLQRNYLEHLDRLAVANADKINRQADTNLAEAAEIQVGAATADHLFYVDNAGGDDKEKRGKTKKKRAKKKKKQTTKPVEVLPARKRSCASRS